MVLAHMIFAVSASLAGAAVEIADADFARKIAVIGAIYGFCGFLVMWAHDRKERKQDRANDSKRNKSRSKKVYRKISRHYNRED